MNYTANKEKFPTRIDFEDGTSVVLMDSDGRPYLDVVRDGKQTPMYELLDKMAARLSERSTQLDELRSALIRATEAENFEALFGDGSLLAGMSPKDIYELGYVNFYLAFKREMYPNAATSLAEAVKDARGRNNPPSKPTTWACSHDKPAVPDDQQEETNNAE